MKNETHLLEKIICDNCKYCSDKELLRGHRRRGFCRKGYSWVPLGKLRQCLYHEVRK